MSNGTFTIPELRCGRHFYGALCPQQAQAPVNEGIVIVPPCEECEAIQAERDKAFEAMREALRDLLTDAVSRGGVAVIPFAVDKARAALALADKVSK